MFRPPTFRRFSIVPLLAGLVALSIAAAPVSGAGGWSTPTAAGTVTFCSDVSTAVDADGAQHVAAECGTRVRYLTNASGSWVTTTFGHPVGRADLVPQISIDEENVYVAYTRASFLFCGIDSKVATVYYRWKPLSGGAWSSPTRLGMTGDRLQAFHVRDAVLHATVNQLDGDIVYETSAGGSLGRYVLPGSVGRSALAIGTDGVARIVYQTASLMRYAVFHGSGVEWSAIPGVGAEYERPLLALDSENRAHVVYSHGPIGQRDSLQGPLCGDDIPFSNDGTYYVTNATGEWTPASGRRFTRNLGADSLLVNAESGAVDLLVAGRDSIKHYTKPARGAWSGVTIASQTAEDVALALDGPSGQLVAAYSRILPDGELGGLVSLTKP